MRIAVDLRAEADDGSPLWAYTHVEEIPATDDVQENALRLAAALEARAIEGTESVKAQAAVESPLLAGEQLGRCEECGHGLTLHLAGGTGRPVTCRFQVPERGNQQCGCAAAL